MVMLVALRHDNTGERQQPQDKALPALLLLTVHLLLCALFQCPFDPLHSLGLQRCSELPSQQKQCKSFKLVN